MVEQKSQIVKSNSEAYGYNYASLADIVNQGFELPKMETRCIEGQLFMGWLDDKGEWRQGAPVIVPEMKGSNAAQAMGAALTYSRRFTAQMALGLACDDDSKLEKAKSAGTSTIKAFGNKIDFKQVREKITTIASVDELNQYWRSLKLSEKQANILKGDFAKRKSELDKGGENGVE